VRIGRVPLGLQRPGAAPICWHLRVAGRRLTAGRYLAGARAAARRVLEVGPPGRIVVR
jgi:hypothetical protein